MGDGIEASAGAPLGDQPLFGRNRIISGRRSTSSARVTRSQSNFSISSASLSRRSMPARSFSPGFCARRTRRGRSDVVAPAMVTFTPWREGFPAAPAGHKSVSRLSRMVPVGATGMTSKTVSQKNSRRIGRRVHSRAPRDPPEHDFSLVVILSALTRSITINGARWRA